MVDKKQIGIVEYDVYDRFASSLQLCLLNYGVMVNLAYIIKIGKRSK